MTNIIDDNDITEPSIVSIMTNAGQDLNQIINIINDHQHTVDNLIDKLSYDCDFSLSVPVGGFQGPQSKPFWGAKTLLKIHFILCKLSQLGLLSSRVPEASDSFASVSHHRYCVLWIRSISIPNCVNVWSDGSWVSRYWTVKLFIFRTFVRNFFSGFCLFGISALGNLSITHSGPMCSRRTHFMHKYSVNMEGSVLFLRRTYSVMR